jgi:hypothetical protein
LTYKLPGNTLQQTCVRFRLYNRKEKLDSWDFGERSPGGC